MKSYFPVLNTHLENCVSENEHGRHGYKKEQLHSEQK